MARMGGVEKQRQICRRSFPGDDLLCRCMVPWSSSPRYTDAFLVQGPPPVRRPRPAASELDYGGPGAHEPDHGRSPSLTSLSPVPSSLRPSGLASPSGHLRQSQSQVFPSPSQTPVSEFGNTYRPSSTGTASSTHSLHPARFPSPAHSLSSNSIYSLTTGADDYNPPYAQSSLTHSASHQTLRPHRASMTSFPTSASGDIDSLLRPLSSISISKPLPMPSGPSPSPYSVALPVSRPTSTQIPTPFPAAPHLQHHAASDAAIAYNHAAGPAAITTHPHPSHRHSIQTYLPASQMGHAPDWSPHDAQGQQHGRPNNTTGHASSNSLSAPWVPQHANASWADPRAASPQYAGYATPEVGDYRQPSPSRPYGNVLQSPGSYAQQHHPEALVPGRSPPPMQAQFTASPHSIHHVAMQQLPVSPSQIDSIAMHPAATSYDDRSGYSNNQNSGYDHHAGQTVYQSPDPSQNYSHDPQYDHAQAQHQHSQDATDVQQFAYPQDGLQPYNGQSHLSEPHNMSTPSNDRLSSPYRPLPQPETKQTLQNCGTFPQAGYADAQQSQYVQNQFSPYDHAAQASQTHQSSHYSADGSTIGYSSNLSHSTSVSSQHQPRFGLPVHQPYDPPYVPPSARLPASSYTEQYAAPPNLPPVPDDLRRESHQQQLYWEQQQQQQQVQQQYGHDHSAAAHYQTPYGGPQQYSY